MVATVLLLNGPNLELLGMREPEVYGTDTLDDHVGAAAETATARGIELRHVQSSSEAELVGAIHAARGVADGIIINAAAFTHYSWAIRDALATFDGPIVELHISNPAARENWRHDSVISAVATGVISGFGGQGYVMAVDAVADLIDR